MRAAIILLALVGATIAVPKNSQRIVGGEATTIEEYPYMASMNFGWLGIIWYQACGGSLITSTAVLSAAHCYSGDSPSQWRVLLGSSYPTTGGTEFNVGRLDVHEGYNSVTIDNDVAIVHLVSPATFGPSIGVARIAGPNFQLPDNSPVHAIGWGTLFSGGPQPDKLQHVQIYTINQELCAERYAHLKTLPGFQNWPDITEGMLCAGVLDVGGRDACQGDSGGPLSFEGDIVVGVTSWGYGCAHETYPGVNARVSTYSNWIVAHA